MMDLVLYNRRKRKEWAVIERENRASALAAAQEAVANRTASEAQVAIVEHEREKAEEAERKKNRKWRDFWFAGMSKEETPGGRMGASAGKLRETPEGRIPPAVVEQEQEQEVPMSVGRAVEDLREEKRVAQARRGGQLDQMAANAAQASRDGAGGWMSWTRGR